MERVTVHRSQLTKSRTLNDAGLYILILPEFLDEEQVFLGLSSESQPTEQAALDQLQVVEDVYSSSKAMKGDKVYVLEGEIKVWHQDDSFVAYERICFPGVNAERALEIRALFS